MNLPAQTLGRQLEELVAHFVILGEQIVWWSRPSFMMRAAVPLLWANLVIVAAIALVASQESVSLQRPEVWAGLGYSVLLVVIGFLAFVLGNWQRQRYTLYLLTTHRAIAFEATSSTSFLILECWPEDLSTLRAHWNGIEWVDGRDPNRAPRHGHFRGIWHAREVKRLVTETLRSWLEERFLTGDPAVQRAAITSVAVLCGPEWAPVELLQQAERCTDPAVQLLAGEVLTKLGIPSFPRVASLVEGLLSK